MQLIKWCFLFVILFVAAVLSLPFMALALWVNEYDTKQFLESTGGALGRKCATDLRR